MVGLTEQPGVVRETLKESSKGTATLISGEAFEVLAASPGATLGEQSPKTVVEM